MRAMLRRVMRRCPTGAKHTRPGQRPGENDINPSPRALQGRRNRGVCQGGADQVTPCQGFIVYFSAFPGRWPGLACGGPYGAEGRRTPGGSVVLNPGPQEAFAGASHIDAANFSCPSSAPSAEKSGLHEVAANSVA
jgi:hypothetical protein